MHLRFGFSSAPPFAPLFPPLPHPAVPPALTSAGSVSSCWTSLAGPWPAPPAAARSVTASGRDRLGSRRGPLAPAALFSAPAARESRGLCFTRSPGDVPCARRSHFARGPPCGSSFAHCWPRHGTNRMRAAVRGRLNSLRRRSKGCVCAGRKDQPSCADPVPPHVGTSDDGVGPLPTWHAEAAVFRRHAGRE